MIDKTRSSYRVWSVPAALVASLLLISPRAEAPVDAGPVRPAPPAVAAGDGALGPWSVERMLFPYDDVATGPGLGQRDARLVDLEPTFGTWPTEKFLRACGRAGLGAGPGADLIATSFDRTLGPWRPEQMLFPYEMSAVTPDIDGFADERPQGLLRSPRRSGGPDSLP